MSKYVLGLDVGERRIGVALASLAARLPAPLMTLERVQNDSIHSKIAKIAEEQQADTVVVGLPRGLDGQETAQTKSTRQFAADLSEYLTVPVVLQDEAGTSIEAEALLKSYRKPYTKADVDAQAAVVILRDWLSQNVEATA